MASTGNTIRSAFLIGQEKYEHFPKLEYAGNDVRGMDEVLRTKCGFQVTPMMNAKKGDFDVLLRQFAQSLRGCEGAIGLLYYAGHALYCNGQLFLVPVDAADESPSSCVNLYDLIKNVHDIAEGACKNTRDRAATATSAQAAPRSKILIVTDSCRKRPQGTTDEQWEVGSMTGARPPRAVTTEISFCFACDEGKAARESHELQHGFFTAAFIRALECPGLTWEQVCSMAREGCIKESRGCQRPWSLQSMSPEGSALVLHNRTDVAVSTLADEEAEIAEIAVSIAKTRSLFCAAGRLTYGALSLCATKVVAQKDSAWASFDFNCFECLAFATIAMCRFRALHFIIVYHSTHDQVGSYLPGVVEAYLFTAGPAIPKQGLCKVLAMEWLLILLGWFGYEFLFFAVAVMILGCDEDDDDGCIERAHGWLWSRNMERVDCYAGIVLVVATMVHLHDPHDPDAVRPLQMLRAQEGRAQHPYMPPLAHVCIKWLPFWLMQGAVCFILLESVRNVPWFLRVPLEVLLAAPLAFCFGHCWLRRVTGDILCGWNCIEVLLFSVLASQIACSFCLSFDPAMNDAARGINYEAFITLVEMSAIALRMSAIAFCRRTTPESWAPQQSVPLSSYQPPTV